MSAPSRRFRYLRLVAKGVYQRSMYRVIALVLSLVGFGVLIEVPSQAVESLASGTTTTYAYASRTGTVHYRLFTPSTYVKGRALPLVVVVHGCGLTSHQEEEATLYDQVARRHNFLVLYPDDDDRSHLGRCWQFYNPTLRRDSGDLATIAGMTRAVERIRTVNRQRIYAIGTSSGGLILSDLVAAYPDIYAAIGLMAGGPYGPDLCMTGLPGIADAAVAARGAFAAEARRRRVVPFIVLNGDADHVVSPVCGAEAVEQWLRANNLVISGRQTAPVSLSSASTTDHAPAVPGGYRYTVWSYRLPSGALIGLHYVIHGMGHGWSGGTSDPAYASSSNPLVAPSRPLGPSASEASWAFFSRFTLAGSRYGH